MKLLHFVSMCLIVSGTGTMTIAQNMPNTPDGPADGWYVFSPKNTTADGAIGLSSWIDKPAGKSGRIVRDGDRLSVGGEAIKLWGLNNCYGTCAPDKPLAERRAAFYAKYGVNAVRLHKYADGTGWAGIQSKTKFAEFDPAGLARMDYYIAQLKKQGIYTKLSATFGVKLGSDDRADVPYMDEFGKLEGDDGRVHTGHGSIFLMSELQDLQIRQMVNLLKHTNPDTGLTYAQEPAIAVIELFNEDSSLFYGTMQQLQTHPAVRKRAGERFTDWLKAKYGSEQKLLEAWGPGALNSFEAEKLTGESFADRTIVPAGNPWFYDPDQLAGSQAPKRARLLDTMMFLYDIQNEFYDKYVKAIRATGYDGEILGSNWQAGRAISHYLNLHSDWRIGMIDRHNYFGGGDNGRFEAASMLQTPGGGMLSTGMQQAADRPFSLSEWIHVRPNEWGVEGPAIIGAYGMGLSGWDVSFMFQNRDDGRLSERVGRDAWDVTAPQVMGVFPAVSRQVLRGDVSQSDLVIPRYVDVPSLATGKLGFDDQATQSGDVKSFGDAARLATLAVGRPVVQFVDEFQETPAFDLSSHIQDGAFVSSTGQLAWTPGKTPQDGHIVINTPGTQAVVGFASGQTIELADARITPQSRFAAIYLSADGKTDTIAEGKSVLITAIARARNTGMTFNDAGDSLTNVGEPPVRMEAVKATITLKRDGARVEKLDHDGMPTGKFLTVKEGVITLDGDVDQTPYYRITWQ